MNEIKGFGAWLVCFIVVLPAGSGLCYGGTEPESQRYEITIIENPNDPENRGLACGINDNGEVVGSFPASSSKPRAFLYKYGAANPLTPDEDFAVRAVTINDAGDILTIAGDDFERGGYICDRSFIYKLGERIELDFAGSDMNNKGQVVGEHYLYSGGEKINLGQECTACAINDNGQIVGELESGSAFIWEDGTIRQLNRPYYYEINERGEISIVFYNCCALDINNNGQIVGCFGRGYRWYNGGAHACLWDEDGQITQLDDQQSRACAINDKGQIIGISEGQPVLYDGREKIYLNDFIPANFEWGLVEHATDLNNNGQIVGALNTCSYGGSGGGFFDDYYCKAAFVMNPAEAGTTLKADINNDRIVNFLDLGILATEWLSKEGLYPHPNSKCMCRNGIEYCLGTDKGVYAREESVEISFSITNLSDQAVAIPCSRTPEVNLQAEREAEVLWMQYTEFYWFSTGIYLEPGESMEVTYTLPWDRIDGMEPYEIVAVVYNEPWNYENIGAWTPTVLRLSILRNFVPVIRLIEPGENQRISSYDVIEIEAEASDVDGFVETVEFYARNNKIAEDTDGDDGWKTVWDDYKPEGSYPLSARAVDNNGAVGYSPTVTLTVPGSGPR